jgi:hypothetical protein
MRTRKHNALVPELEPDVFISGWQAVVAAENSGLPMPLMMMEGVNAVGQKQALTFLTRFMAAVRLLDDPRIAEWTNEDGLHVAVLVAAATTTLRRQSLGFDVREFFQNVRRFHAIHPELVTQVLQCTA